MVPTLAPMTPPTDAEFAAILGNVSKHIVLSPEEQRFWRGLLRSKHVSKGDYLLEMGDVSLYQHFVVHGCLRVYHVGEDGKEHILQFAPEDWWTGNMSSMLKNQPSQLIIEAMEDTVVLQMRRQAALRTCTQVRALLPHPHHQRLHGPATPNAKFLEQDRGRTLCRVP